MKVGGVSALDVCVGVLLQVRVECAAGALLPQRDLTALDGVLVSAVAAIAAGRAMSFSDLVARIEAGCSEAPRQAVALYTRAVCC